MVHVYVVFGEWDVNSWHFLVDKRRGGKLLSIEDSCTHEELLQKIHEEYNLDNHADQLELGYALPASILSQMPHGTPPIFVTNDGQVRSFIEFGKSHVLQLCVSPRRERKLDDDDDDDNVDGKDDGGDDIKDDPYDSDDAYESDDDEDYIGEDVYSDGEDFSDIGRVKDEDDDDDDIDEDVAAVLDEKGLKAIDYVQGNNSRLLCVDNIHVNKSYTSKAELVLELRKLSLVKHFGFKAHKSTKTLFIATCRVVGCKWRLRAKTLSEDSESFWVTKFLEVHTCSIADRFSIHTQCAPRYIARVFMEGFGIIDGITAKHIQESMKKRYGIKMSYNTAYRALMHAQELVRGTPEDGYGDLPSYLHLIQKANPGTVTGLEMDEDDRFKYLFIAYGASISGFEFIRRVVVVDGTHLTGKYKGVMLVATAQDGNFQIYPLAFGIVDSENDDSWEWFFTKLRTCISDENPLVIVSDRHKSIARACAKIFPKAKRGICYYHLQNNIVTKFKGRDIMYLVRGAAYAYTVSEFNQYMDEIRRSNKDLAVYLEQADVRLWSRVHFAGDRYNIKTSNIAESINSLLKEARRFPISCLLEYIRERLGRWFNKRRENAIQLETQHTRRVEFLLYKRSIIAGKLGVQQIDPVRFYVTGGSLNCIVDLQLQKCGCGVFDIEKIPCEHAIAAATSVDVNISASVEPTYTKGFLYAGYLGSINPKMDGLQAPNEILATNCLPPLVRRPPGRQRKSRYQSHLEVAMRKRNKPRKVHKPYTCSKCNQTGHNRSTCV